MRARLRGLIGLLASLAAFPTTADDLSAVNAPDASASAHFAAGTESFERGDFASAREAFRAAIAAGIQGPAAHYNAAVADYRLGDFAAAESSFRDLGRRFPELAALAEYNRGLALIGLDENQAARDAFERAAEAEDEKIVTLALAMLERLPAPAAAVPARWYRLLEAAIGHDDNVVLADPLGLPAGRSADSDFAELGFYSGGPVTASDSWTLSANAYLLDYADAPEYDQTAFHLAATHASAAGSWTLSAGPRIGLSTIGGDGFEQYMGATVDFSRPFTAASSSLSIALSFDSAAEIDERFAYIDGDRSTLMLSYDRALARARLILDYRLSEDDRAGAGVSAGHDRYRLTWRRALGRLWTNDFVVEYRHTTYDELQPVREENRLQAGLRAQRRLGPDWRLNLRYGYADNDSSDPRYAYRRHLLGVGASRIF